MYARFAILAVVIAPGAVFAQQHDTVRIAPVVVTATSVASAVATSPVSVTVISGDDLRARGVTSVVDALRSVPGVQFAQSGGEGANTSLFLRGGESKYVKVLVDGVPLNDPGGAFDFGSLTVDDIDRIEVVRGPASVLYGADAVTGVIQVFTRSFFPGTRTTVAARAGTYDSRDLDAYVRATVGRSDYTLGLARHDTKGIYAFNSGYGNTTFSGASRLRLDDRTELQLTLRYADDVFHYPTNSGGQVVDSNAFRSQDRTTASVKLSRVLASRVDAALSLTSNEAAGGTDDRPDTPSSGGYQSLDRTRRRGVDVHTGISLGHSSSELILGGSTEEEDQRSVSQSVFGSYQSTDIFRASRSNQAAYAQFVTLQESAAAASFTAGARLDRNEQFGSFGTYRLGGTWRMPTATLFRASVGTAFREPSFFENYATGYVTGNPRLEPEHSLAWEAALSQPLLHDRITATITHFEQRFRNMIDYTVDTTACGASYCNVATARSNGNEIELAAEVIPALRLGANLTHLETKVLDPGFDTSTAGLYRRGEQLIRRPTTSWNASATYSAARGSLDVRASHVGERSDRDYTQFPAVPVSDPAYTIVDVGSELPLTFRESIRPAMSLTLRVENLFDARYQSIYDFPMPRRAIFAGARVAF